MIGGHGRRHGLMTSASIVAMQHTAKSKPKIARELWNGMLVNLGIEIANCMRFLDLHQITEPPSVFLSVFLSADRRGAGSWR
jgi:hypothetical protein